VFGEDVPGIKTLCLYLRYGIYPNILNYNGNNATISGTKLEDPDMGLFLARSGAV